MAKISINDRQVTIISDYQMEELLTIAKVSPDTLCLMCKETNCDDVFFSVMPNPGCVASTLVHPEWIILNDTTLDGKAKVSFTVPGDTADEVKENAFVLAGEAFTNLKKVEQNIAAWKTARTASKAEFIAALS